MITGEAFLAAVCLSVGTIAASVAKVSDQTPPTSQTFEIPINERSIGGPELIPAGSVRLRLTNVSGAQREVEIIRLDAGKSIADLRVAPDGALPSWGQLVHSATMNPGETTELALTLRSGSYAVVGVAAGAEDTGVTRALAVW